MTLIFVRHGQSEANARGVYAGGSDSVLTAAGHAEAGSVASRLAGTPAAVIYSSPLSRARQTADAIANATGLAIEEVDSLREHSLGDAEGLQFAEARRRWGASSPTREIPHFEPWPDFRARVDATFDSLFAQHSGDAAIVVGHGGWLLRAAAHVFGLGDGDPIGATTTNCAITLFESIDGVPVVTTWNDGCHLRQRGSPRGDRRAASG